MLLQPARGVYRQPTSKTRPSKDRNSYIRWHPLPYIFLCSSHSSSIMSSTAELPQFLCLEKYDLPRDTLSECKHLFFTPKTVATAISKGCSRDNLKEYLQSYERETIERQISDDIHGRHPVIFHAAKRNAFDIVELLLEYGAIPKQRIRPTSLCLLQQSCGQNGHTRMSTESLHFCFHMVQILTVYRGTCGPHTSRRRQRSTLRTIPYALLLLGSRNSTALFSSRL